MQDEIKMLKYTSEKLIQSCFVCIGLILVTLIGGWVLNDEETNKYSKQWITNGADARSKSALIVTQTVLLQAQQAANMLASSHRLGLLDLQVCNQDSAGNCTDSINIPATKLAFSYASLLAQDYYLLDHLNWATVDGYYTHTNSVEHGSSAQLEFVSPLGTPKAGGTNQRVAQLSISDSLLWTLDWDLADVVTQSIVSWEETTGQSWSSQAVLEPKLQNWYAKSVDDFIQSGQSASFDHGKHIDAVAYSGALHFTINLFNTTQSQFPSILVASEIALPRLDNALMELTSQTGGVAYIVDSAGNLVATSTARPLNVETNYVDKPISAHEADADEFPGIKETANYILSQFNTFTQARGFTASAMFALKVCTSYPIVRCKSVVLRCFQLRNTG